MFLPLSPDHLPGMMITESPAATETSPSQPLAGAEGGTVPFPRTPCPARGGHRHRRDPQFGPYPWLPVQPHSLQHPPCEGTISSPSPAHSLCSIPPLPIPLHKPAATSRHCLGPAAWEGGPAVPCPPSWMWLPCATRSSGSPHRVGQGCHCPLVHYAHRGSPPRLPSPAAFVPGASCPAGTHPGSVPSSSSSSSHPWPQAESWHQLLVLGW